jgi:hypothetical protein
MNPMIHFTCSQLETYSWHIILEEVGIEGQENCRICGENPTITELVDEEQVVF